MDKIEIKTKILKCLIEGKGKEKEKHGIQYLEREEGSNEITGYGNYGDKYSVIMLDVKSMILSDCCIDSFYSNQVDDILNELLGKNLKEVQKEMLEIDINKNTVI